MGLILLLAAAAVSDGAPLRLVQDRVDVVEINHFYDDGGRLVFDQAIFWGWCPCACRHQVLGWRLVKHPSQLPARDRARGGWVLIWMDGERLRHVWAASYRESWTQEDPELLERQILSTDERKELFR